METHRLTALALLLFLVLLPSALGVGLRPAEVEEYYEPMLSKYVNLKIHNPEGKNMKVTAYAKGDLADFISFPVQIADIKEHEIEKVFSYKIDLPAHFQQQGTLTTDIVVVAIPEKDEGKTVVLANIELVSILRLVVPYGGKYVEANLFIPRLESDKQSDIIVDIKNHGTENIQRAIAVIDVFTPLNQKILTLRSNEVPLDPKEKKTLLIPFPTGIDNGVYRAKLTVIYDGNNAQDERVFAVGVPEVIVSYISVENFRLGGIAKFDIILESRWNQNIDDLFGVATVLDNSQKALTSYKTASTDIEAFGMQSMEAYWNTESAGTGNYDLQVDLFYLDRKGRFTTDITVTPNEIKTAGAVGMVVSGNDRSADAMLLNTQMLLVVIILILGALTAAYLYNSFRKK